MAVKKVDKKFEKAQFCFANVDYDKEMSVGEVKQKPFSKNVSHWTIGPKFYHWNLIS